jgi:hypothetical protein
MQASAAPAVYQNYISAIVRRLTEPGAPILFSIARLYWKAIEWLLTGRRRGSQLLLASSEQQRSGPHLTRRRRVRGDFLVDGCESCYTQSTWSGSSPFRRLRKARALGHQIPGPLLSPLSLQPGILRVSEVKERSAPPLLDGLGQHQAALLVGKTTSAFNQLNHLL